MNENKKTIFAYKIKRGTFYMTAIAAVLCGIGFFASANNKGVFAYVFLAFFVLDLIINFVRYMLGYYTRVVLNDEGFVYKKFTEGEYVPWAAIASVDEGFPHDNDIRYYIIVTDDGDEYLIEKNRRTEKVLNRYIPLVEENKDITTLHDNTESTLRFLGSFALITLSLTLAVIFANFRNDDITNITLYSFIVYLSVNALAAAVYFALKNSNRYKFTNYGIKVITPKKTTIIGWSMMVWVEESAEFYGNREYDYINITYNTGIRDQYKTIRIPYFLRHMEKLENSTDLFYDAEV